MQVVILALCNVAVLIHLDFMPFQYILIQFLVTKLIFKAGACASWKPASAFLVSWFALVQEVGVCVCLPPEPFTLNKVIKQVLLSFDFFIWHLLSISWPYWWSKLCWLYWGDRVLQFFSVLVIDPLIHKKSILLKYRLMQRKSWIPAIRVLLLSPSLRDPGVLGFFLHSIVYCDKFDYFWLPV